MFAISINEIKDKEIQQKCLIFRKTLLNYNRVFLKFDGWKQK